MKKMKPKIKEQWIAALRSGDYKKGIRVLRDEKNNFCCLGVLCNLHAIAHPKVAAKQKDQSAYLGENTLLPEEVQQWSGIQSNLGYLGMDIMFCSSLASLNDNGASFNEIADIIEKHF